MLLPDDLTPRAMRDALGALLEAPPPAPPADEYEGADRSARLLSELADHPRARRHVPHRPTRSSARDPG
jgi:predicted glycosyltransferase